MWIYSIHETCWMYVTEPPIHLRELLSGLILSDVRQGKSAKALIRCWEKGRGCVLQVKPQSGKLWIQQKVEGSFSHRVAFLPVRLCISLQLCVYKLNIRFGGINIKWLNLEPWLPRLSLCGSTFALQMQTAASSV